MIGRTEVTFARGQAILRPFGLSLQRERDGRYYVYDEHGVVEVNSKSAYMAVVNALEIVHRTGSVRDIRRAAGALVGLGWVPNPLLRRARTRVRRAR